MHLMKLIAIAALGVFGAGAAHADEALRAEAGKTFGRVEAVTAAATPEVNLGRTLFWDARISLDGKTACASCHTIANWGADGRRYSTDAKGAMTARHAPTVFNTSTMPAIRWLGDRKNLAELAEGLLTGPMGFATKDAAVDKMKELQYDAQFRAAYPQDPAPVTAANYARAIAAYETTLSTPAPFDRFVAGNDAALSAAQQAGLRAFIATGCSACHNGPLLGGMTFTKFGVTKDYWTETGSEKQDIGREAFTMKPEDKYVFRVAPLRNIAKTAPYFHDGSVATLDRAVRVMATVQLGKTLDDATAASLVTFLESLTGEVPANYSAPK